MKENLSYSVFLLDGSQKSTLAVLRSLSGKGIRCTVGEYFSPHLCLKSKFCYRNVLYPSPYDNINEFKKFIMQYIEKNKVDAVFPMTDVTIPLVIDVLEKSKFSRLVSHIRMEGYNKGSNKLFLMNLAKTISVPFPKTIVVNEKSDILYLANNCKYPVVVKPEKSKIIFNDKYIPLNVTYAKDPEELLLILKTFLKYKRFIMVQELIQGEGVGYFSLWENGRQKLKFFHKRILEKPPSGGVSVLCKSVSEDLEIEKYATKILEKLKWHGVVMVEFKKEFLTGIPYLMEINARFWGSLELAIKSGVDFPFETYQMVCGKKINLNQGNYTIGTCGSWFVGIIDHFYLLLKNKNYSTIKMSLKKLAYNRNFSDFVYDRNDIKPFIFEMYNNIKNVF